MELDGTVPRANYPHAPMQTRLLLIASALLAIVILVAGGIWLIRLLA